MDYSTYSQDTDRYELKQGFSLHRASNVAFVKAWVVYRRVNEDFTQSFAEQYSDLKDVPFCFWICQDGRKVGGVVMLPNNIGDFFLIPPFTDAFAVLQAILPLLRHWSDPGKDIHAQAMSLHYLDTFCKSLLSGKGLSDKGQTERGGKKNPP
ncbi:hypothetical protein KFU94_50860 [Chloroflexi bacterium TSY]|nr:hypothetical protein [Chloroflexi bacterium TSY]